MGYGWLLVLYGEEGLLGLCCFLFGELCVLRVEFDACGVAVEFDCGGDGGT